VPPEAAAAMARVLAGEAATETGGATAPPAGETAEDAPEGEGDLRAEGDAPGESEAGEEVGESEAGEEEGAARHDA
jgi:hypothetical protein